MAQPRYEDPESLNPARAQPSRDPHCGLTEGERIYILMALAVARAKLNRTIAPHEAPGLVPVEVYREFVNVLQTPNFVGKLPWVPSHNAVRVIWRNLVVNKSVQNDKSGRSGRRKLKVIRLGSYLH